MCYLVICFIALKIDDILFFTKAVFRKLEFLTNTALQERSFREENQKLLVIRDFDYLNSSSCRELNALQDGWPKTALKPKPSKLSIAENPYFPVSKRHFELFRKMIS